MLSLRQLRMYIDGTNCLTVERLKRTSLEKVSDIHNAERVTQIRLVGTKLQHRLLIAYDRIWCLSHFCSLWCKFFKSSTQHFLTNAEYIFLCCKTHFKIKLIKLSG